MAFTEQYDVVVVGAGHAGCEAAVAAARMGLRTAIFTLNLDLIAQMSCNPAIGGVAKGHLVREVDALGGVMGEVADACGIQFRLLNTSRGPAVWSPRAQCDKALYRVKMREVLEGQKNLFIKQAEVVDLVVEDREGEIQGSLHSATDDETVRRSGRDDASSRVVRGLRLRDGRVVLGGRDRCDYGDVFEWVDSLWGAAVYGWSEWGAGECFAGGGAEAAGVAGVPVEDGDSSAAGWADD